MKTEILIKLLNEHKVRYVIIGAIAVIAHGHTRLTKDVDFAVDPAEENIRKTLQALKDFGYDISDVTIKEAQEKKLLFRQYIIETDIHPMVKGISFEKLWANRFECLFRGEKAYFASIDDLITMKEEANRPKDQEDLRFLRKIKELKK